MDSADLHSSTLLYFAVKETVFMKRLSLTEGDIFKRTVYDLTILKEQPTNCPGYDPAEERVQKIIAFDNRWKEAQGWKRAPESGIFIHFDDTALSQIKAANLGDPRLVGKGNVYGVLPGETVAPFLYNSDSDVFTFNMAEVQPNGIERTVIWRCNVIDLGADGIDACDARLNEVTDIPAANKKYVDCMNATLDKVQERYPQHFE